MRKIIFLSTIIMLSIFSKAQETKLNVDFSSPFKTTEITVKAFEIKKVETAFDLAINLSYFHTISQGFSDEYLILPIVILNNKPLDEVSLKKISISEIYEYQFKSGNETETLYGNRGKYGLLYIVLKNETIKGKNEN